MRVCGFVLGAVFGVLLCSCGNHRKPNVPVTLVAGDQQTGFDAALYALWTDGYVADAFDPVTFRMMAVAKYEQGAYEVKWSNWSTTGTVRPKTSWILITSAPTGTVTLVASGHAVHGEEADERLIAEVGRLTAYIDSVAAHFRKVGSPPGDWRIQAVQQLRRSVAPPMPVVTRPPTALPPPPPPVMYR